MCPTMNTLYDSESFVVVHLQASEHPRSDATSGDAQHQIPAMPRHGFEIVDKRSGKEIYLEGSWAELLQNHLRAWQENAPSQEEVEETLAGFAELAQNPVLVH